MADDTQTVSQLADEAHQVGRDASTAASDLAGEVKTIAANATEAWRTTAADATATAGEALDTVRGVAADAAGTGRAYAQEAVHEARRTMTSLRERAGEWQASCVKHIAAEPVKAVLMAAAGGALLAGLLLVFDRPALRHDD
jgi:ElaB/YqjD/DUF883 family membrane-anchored ribosome-binding protein